MATFLANFLNTSVPDNARGELVFEAANGKRLVNGRLGKIRSFLKSYPDTKMKLVTDDGERFGFSLKGPVPDRMPPPTLIIGDVNVWLLDKAVDEHAPYAKALEFSFPLDFVPIGDIDFVGEESRYYASRDLWQALNTLKVATAEEFIEAEREALANGRLIAGENFSDTYYPKADTYIDVRGREHPIVYNEYADDFAEETGLTVFAHPPWTYNDGFGPGWHLPNRLQVIVANSRKKKFTKKFIINENGEKKKIDYQNEKKVWTFTVVINNFEELAKALAALLPMQNACVIRGHCVDTSWYLCNRRYLPKSNRPTPPSFCEAPSQSFFADVDTLKMPNGLSYDQPERMAKYARASLPPSLHKAAMFYQYSSSAAVWTEDMIKIHCAFWLDEPITCKKIKEWGKGTHIKRTNRRYESILDHSPFQPVQPLYTSGPELKDGIEDPLEGRRVGVLPGGPFADIAEEVEAANAIVVERETRPANRRVTPSEPQNHFLAAAKTRSGDGEIPRRLWKWIYDNELMCGSGSWFHLPTYKLIRTAIDNGVTDFELLKREYVKIISEKYNSLPVADQRDCADHFSRNTSDERFNDLIESCTQE